MNNRGYFAVICLLVSILMVYRYYPLFRKQPLFCARSYASDVDDRLYTLSKTRDGSQTRSQVRNSTASVRDRFLHRKKVLQNSCRRLGLNRTTPSTRTDVDRLLQNVKLLHSDRYKVLICEIPKCGCSSVKKLLLVAEGLVNYTDPQDVSSEKLHSFADERLDLKHLRNVSEILKRMKSYRKLVIVRDPINRLVSAYRNKMEEEHPWNKDFSKISREIHAKFSSDDGKLATFGEFLRYLKQEKKLERHWDYFHHLCAPCTLEYEFIAHIETIADDMRYFMDMVGMGNISFPHNYEKSRETNEEKTRKYLAGVQEDTIYKIVEKYKSDYELFDFEFKL